MTDEKKKAIMNCTSFDEILNEEYGAMGTPERMKFEADAEAFCLAETLKEQRLLAGLTQQELADNLQVLLNRNWQIRLEPRKAISPNWRMATQTSSFLHFSVYLQV